MSCFLQQFTKFPTWPFWTGQFNRSCSKLRQCDWYSPEDYVAKNTLEHVSLRCSSIVSKPVSFLSISFTGVSLDSMPGTYSKVLPPRWVPPYLALEMARNGWGKRGNGCSLGRNRGPSTGVYFPTDPRRITLYGLDPWKLCYSTGATWINLSFKRVVGFKISWVSYSPEHFSWSQQ